MYGLFSSCGERGLASSCSVQASHCGGFSRLEHWLRGAQASVAVPSVLWSADSIVMVYGLSCSTTRGIFPGQGWNPCLLHWQADSLLLCHQGSPERHLSFECWFVSCWICSVVLMSVFRLLRVFYILSSVTQSCLTLCDPMNLYTRLCLSVNRDNFIYSFLMWMPFLSFSCLIPLARSVE